MFRIYKDMTGKRFGRLTALSLVRKGKLIYWDCVCDCGNRKMVWGANLRNGGTQSCGCYRKERIIESSITHGKSKEKLYHIYMNMIDRCSNPKHTSYKYYGERGIKVCVGWTKGYLNFRKWALENGYKDGLSVDRIDNNKNYQPSNCRWVTSKEQGRNKRNNIKYKGETMSEAERRLNLYPSALSYRVSAGWSLEEAFTTPKSKRKSNSLLKV